jgi:phosphopantothenoylcysteine decarboxylase/phosphopantothenate--cysteine ligase
LNSLRDPGAGFGVDTNRITIFIPDGTKTSHPLQSKRQAASHIIDRIAKFFA